MLNQMNIFLLSFGALQGLLLSAWFFRKHRNHASNIFIALLLSVTGLQLTFKVITKLWLMQNVYPFYEISYKLPYLIGPLLFLYASSRNGRTFRIKHLWHFVPFILAVLNVAISWFSPRTSLDLHPYAQAALQMISLVVYSFLAGKISSETIRKFVIVFCSIESIIIISLALMYMYYGRFPDVRALFVVLTVLIYRITYQVISRSQQFYALNDVVSLNLEKAEKYAHSRLKHEEADQIGQSLNKLMATERLFLDSSLTIEVLSARLAVSKHKLSQVLNEHLKKTYSEYICELRLEEAKRRLSEPSNFRFTIAALALDSGFSSVSNFNDIFKKRYGITPSHFRNEKLSKKMSA
jgi:AraC-like DNA-binding protein